MAWSIDGLAGRLIGVLMGIAAIVPALVLWGVLGAVSTNVPLPPGVGGVVETAIPLLGQGMERELPLAMVVPPALFVVGFIVLGLFTILGAIFKPDYAVNVRLGGRHRGSGGT